MSIVAYFLYSLSKKLEFVPVASAITAVHSDRLMLALYARWPEIQPPVSRGQIVSTDLPLLMDKYNYTIYNEKYISDNQFSYIVRVIT